MKIIRKTDIPPVHFGLLGEGVIFTPIDDDKTFYLSCYPVKGYRKPSEEPKEFNAVNLSNKDDNCGLMVHFDETEMVIPYSNCTLTVG